jgi:hypothetical protein
MGGPNDHKMEFKNIHLLGTSEATFKEQPRVLSLRPKLHAFLSKNAAPIGGPGSKRNAGTNSRILHRTRYSRHDLSAYERFPKQNGWQDGTRTDLVRDESPILHDENACCPMMSSIDSHRKAASH